MNEIINCSNMITNVINMTSVSGNNLPDIWKKVVSRVKSYNDSDDSERKMPIGQRLAANTRVVDLKNGILLVETDHPGWIQYLKIYQKFIITGLKMEVKDLKVNSLAFRVKGSDFCLSNSYEQQVKKEQNKMNDFYENQEKSLEKYNDSKTTEESKELPPELKEKFDSLINTMLTNGEK